MSSRPGRRGVWPRLARNRLAVAGMVILGSLFLASALAPLLASEQPNQLGVWPTNLHASRLPPSRSHPLGTDQLGRDMLSRMLYGGRTTLLIGISSVSLAIVVGSLLGALGGYVGGVLDNLVMRVADMMLAFPSILLALVIVVLVGPGLMNVMLAVGIVSIPTYARLIRATVLSVRELDYVAAARALGAGNGRILLRHILPNSLAPLMVAASLGIGSAVLDAAGLGFLGLGAQPPLAEWGLMLSDNRQKMFTEWWLVAIPGLAIMLTVLGCNLLGDGLRDVLDPRLRHCARN